MDLYNDETEACSASLLPIGTRARSMIQLTTGLRPTRSETEPHHIPLAASAREKAAIRHPAKKGAFDSEETSKFDTNFQA
jgi:hypothetical protein